MNLFELTKELMYIPSVSGDEEAVGFCLRDHLQSLGWTVELQTVSEDQNNVMCLFERHSREFGFRPTWTPCRRFTARPTTMKRSTAAAAATRKGIIAAQITAAEQC